MKTLVLKWWINPSSLFPTSNTSNLFTLIMKIPYAIHHLQLTINVNELYYPIITHTIENQMRFRVKIAWLIFNNFFCLHFSRSTQKKCPWNRDASTWCCHFDMHRYYPYFCQGQMTHKHPDTNFSQEQITQKQRVQVVVLVQDMLYPSVKFHESNP